MSKAVFPEKPAVRPLAGSDYVLAEDFYFPAEVGEWDVVAHVMPGFRTDGASIPRLLWRVFGSPYAPDIFPAAIAHDALYRGEIVPRCDADAAFFAMMAESGVPKRKRRLVWIGVRLFGWITWLSHTLTSVTEARRHISLAFAGRTTKTNKGKTTMNKLMMMAIAACAAAMTGCKSIEVERHAQTLATVESSDGSVQVVRDSQNNPVVLDGGWNVDYFQHWNWQKFDSLHATAGAGVALDINNYEGGADATNLTQLVHTSLDGLTKLVATAADAYVKVAGGGAQADTALNVAGKVVKYFGDKGGDVTKATVTTDTAANTFKITDGSTCVQCDASGNCTDCSPAAE